MWLIAGLLTAVCILLAVIAVVLIASSSKTQASASPSTSTVAAAPEIFDAGDAATAPSAAPSAPPPLTDAERDELPGKYTCALDDTPPFPCRVSNGTLEKLAGSQRFKGPIRKQPNGNLEFSGTFFCPFGACTHPVATTFVRQGPGRYVGKFGESTLPGGGSGRERVVLIKVR